MTFTSLMVPRIFDACVQATNLVFGDKSFFRSSISILGVLLGAQVHHFTVSPKRSAMKVHGSMLVSWSNFESMSSSPGRQSIALARFLSNCVVEGPITTSHQSAHFITICGINLTNLTGLSIYVPCSSFMSTLYPSRRSDANIVSCAHLHLPIGKVFRYPMVLIRRIRQYLGRALRFNDSSKCLRTTRIVEINLFLFQTRKFRSDVFDIQSCCHFYPPNR